MALRATFGRTNLMSHVTRVGSRYLSTSTQSDVQFDSNYQMCNDKTLRVTFKPEYKNCPTGVCSNPPVTCFVSTCRFYFASAKIRRDQEAQALFNL